MKLLQEKYFKKETISWEGEVADILKYGGSLKCNQLTLNFSG